MATHPRYTALGLERSGRWTAAAVGLVMFAIYLVPTFLNSRISDEHPIEAGTTVTVSGFRYVPEPTWREVRSESWPGKFSTITDGTTTLEVKPVSAESSLPATYDAAARERADDHEQEVGEGAPVTGRGGLPGLRGGLTSDDEAGVLVVFVHNDEAITLTATAPGGLTPAATVQVENMTASVGLAP